MNIFPSTPGRQIPAVTPVVRDCAWCWYALNPDVAYPEHWSSTVCTSHKQWVLASRKPRTARQDCEARP